MIPVDNLKNSGTIQVPNMAKYIDQGGLYMVKIAESEDIKQIKQGIIEFVFTLKESMLIPVEMLEKDAPKIKTDITVNFSMPMLYYLDGYITDIFNDEFAYSIGGVSEVKKLISLTAEHIKDSEKTTAGDVEFAKKIMQHLKLESRAITINEKAKRIMKNGRLSL